MSAIRKSIPEFGIEKPFLSIREATNICPGFGSESCGDEIPKGVELCSTHQKEEDDYYWRIAMAQDKEEEKAGASQYLRLTALQSRQ